MLESNKFSDKRLSEYSVMIQSKRFSGYSVMTESRGFSGYSVITESGRFVGESNHSREKSDFSGHLQTS